MGEKGYLLPQRDVDEISDMLWWFKHRGESDLIRRRRPGTGGGPIKRYARVIQSLRRPDPTADPPITAISNYKIKLLTEAEYDEWSTTHGTYTIGDRVKYEEPSGIFLDYECILEHEAAEGKEPINEIYWKIHSLDAFVLGYHYSDDLIPTCPWFQVEDIIEVIYRDDKYRIHGTVSRVESVDEEKLYTSVQWNDIDKRAMSVFK